MTDQVQSPSPRYDMLAASCPTHQVMTQLGSRWGLLIVAALEHGTVRFNQLRSRVEGITQKVLTENLRTLERNGIVHRQVIPTVPVTVEYSLTPLGRSLMLIVAQLREWAYTNMELIDEARARYDASA